MANSAYHKVTGLAELSTALRGIPKEIRTTILAEAVGSAAEPIVFAAKIYAARSRRTGALQESLTHVVRNYPNNATAVAVIGPDKNYYKAGKVVRGKNRANADRPANYAHLVEFGHIAVRPVKGASRRKKTAQATGIVAAKPFLRPALDGSAQEVMTRFEIGIARGIEGARQQLAKL